MQYKETIRGERISGPHFIVKLRLLWRILTAKITGRDEMGLRIRRW